MGGPGIETEAPASGLGVRLAANTLVQVVGTVSSALIGLATFLALTRGLGPAAFGDFAAAQAYLSLPIVIADIGLTAGLLREISAAPERTEAAMRAFLPLSALVSAATVVVLVAVGLAVPFSDRTKIAIAIGAAGAFLTLMTLALGPVLQSRLQMHWVVVGAITGRLATFGLVLSAFAAGLGFKAAVVAMVIGIAITFAIQLVIVARQISLRPVIDVRYWRRLGTSSLFLGVASALVQINFRVDTVLLAVFRSSSEVGYYGAAYKFAEVGHTTTGSVGISVFPSLARFAATGDARLGRFAQRAFDILLAAAGPAVLVFVAFPNELLRWTAGAEFEPGAVALQILAAFLPFAFVNHVVWRLLAAFHEDRWLVAVSGSALALTLVLDVILIPPYGMKAAALVTVAVEIVAVSLAAVVLLRLHGVFLTPRYGIVVGLATAAAIAVAFALPGPTAVAVIASLAVYGLAVGVAPGAVRELLVELAGVYREALARRRA